MPEITERAKKISTLLAEVNCRLIGDIGDREVTAIETDSRKVVPGALFVAIAGSSTDGHNYIQEALKKGCVAVVGEKGCSFENDALFVEVQDSREVLSEIAAAFYDNPAKELILVGITGTNGKTTTTYLLESIIRSGGYNPGVIGTVNYRFNGKEHPAPFTTPEPVILQKLLREMVQDGVTHLVMEVSSHSLVQKRIYGLKFDLVLFTNLSRDHLDFHGTMRDYFEAKKVLFQSYVKKNGKAFIFCGRSDHKESGEVDWGSTMIQELQVEHGKAESTFEIFSCGLAASNDLHVTDFSCGLMGTAASAVFQGQAISIKSSLVGDFNLKNILAAVGAGLGLGIASDLISKGISELKDVPGRLERVRLATVCEEKKQDGSKPGCSVFVDYAHTPDALKNVLQTMRQLSEGRIIVVFGCGGDRDTGKRYTMGEVAGYLADVVVLTSDNSRTESPVEIMAAIEKGVVASGVEKIDELSNSSKGYLLITDRGEAIKYAVSMALKDDVVLLAGKGHENYQISAEGTVFFDDRIEARKQLERLYQQAA